MKIKNVPGEYGFKALYKSYDKSGWLLSDLYFFTKEELFAVYSEYAIKWPVEIDENGAIYIPAKEEYESEGS